MRKTVLTALLLLAPLIASAAGLQVVIDGRVVTFVDVDEDAWFATYVQAAAEAGIVNGYKDAQGRLTGRFGPADNVTIAQALKIAVEGAGYDEEAYARHYVSGVGNHWASPYVSVAKAEGFALFRGSINLDRAATRAEVSQIFTDAFRVQVFPLEGDSPYRDVPYDQEFAPAVGQLTADGVVSGDTGADGESTGYFRPTSTINRAEIVKMIINARAIYGSPGVGAAPVPVEEEQEVDDTDFFQASVSFNGESFEPAELRVKVGDTVRFVNTADIGLWVAVDPHPVHTDLPGFDAEHEMLPGEFVQFTFDEAGEFGYHNHLNASQRGTIIVEQ